MIKGGQIIYRHLPARIVYNWADIYSQPLQDGQDYKLLQPTYSIWLLSDNLVAGGDYAHDYQLRDRQAGCWSSMAASGCSSWASSTCRTSTRRTSAGYDFSKKAGKREGKLAAMQREAAALKREEAALQEIERLKALLE